LSTDKIASATLSGVNGFGKHAWKPAFNMRARAPYVTKAEDMTEVLRKLQREGPDTEQSEEKEES
jgi:hypothetical protein